MQEVELRAFFRMLGRQRWVIGLTMALCLFVSLTVTLQVIKREYVASSSLLYSPSGMTGLAGSLAGSLGLSAGVASTGPASWFEIILTSRRLAQKMVKKHNLVPVLGAKDERQAVTRLLDRIIITAKPEANAVLVAVKLPGTPIRMPRSGIDRDRAALVAAVTNDLISELQYWLATTEYQSSAKQRKFIENQLQQVLGQINVTREQLVDVFKATGVFAPDQQAQQWLAALTQLENDLTATRAELKGTQISREAAGSPSEINRLAGAAAAAQKSSALTETLRKQLSDLEVQLRQEIEVNHKTEDHPDVAQLRQSIAELKAKLQTELKIVKQTQALEEERLTSQLDLSQTRWSRLQGLIKDLPTQGLEVQQLKRQLETETDLAEMLGKQLLLAQIAEQQQSQDFNVLDPAEPPRQAASPSLLLSVAVGLALGCVLGLIIAAWRAYRSPEPLAGEGAA